MAKETIMKKTIFTTLTLLSLLMTLVGAGAQARPQAALVANVPFEFTIKNQTLPAGRYEVKVAMLGGAEMLTISSDRETKGFYFVHRQSRHGDVAGDPKLVFHRYGDQYFLAQIWQSNDREAITLPVSRAELEVKTAMNNEAPAIVAITLIEH
jgi:hypothetical protein